MRTDVDGARSEAWATMWQSGEGRWQARSSGDDPAEVAAATREECLRELRRVLEDRQRSRGATSALTLVVEVIPVLAGVAEAAEVMRWDKRRVITYIDRGRFPAPIQSLASGRVWARSAVEEFAAEWWARQARRRARAAGSGSASVRARPSTG